VKILSAELRASAAGPEGWPTPEAPEIAVMGRSNVGKSSLLNRMVQRRKLARTSATPGKTRLLHFFAVERPEGRCVLVDLPGYGYAKVSKAERRGWRTLIETYLERREVLRAALLLQDVRRDPGEEERELVAWLGARGIPVVLALTKLDKLKAAERARRLRALAGALPVQADWIVPTSAKTGAGIERLWAVLDTLLGEGAGAGETSAR
jgi:GTP-binding protein